jgi:BMFP domain-containing protein YqiC
MIKMTDKNRIKETADRYINRVKVTTDEAKKAFEKSLTDLDQIGNDMFEDMKVTLKDSGVDLDIMQAKIKATLMKDKEELRKEFWHVQSRMVKFGEEVEQEIRRSFKQP